MDGCPNCREKAEIAGEVLGDVKDAVYDALGGLSEITDAVEAFEANIEEVKKTINHHLKHQ